MTRRPSNEQSQEAHETTVRVTYRDTDQMGHVYYANYLVWFEMGRTEMLRAMNMCYKDWEDRHGIHLPVASCTVHYRLGARYDDEVIIRTRISGLTRASVEFSYDIVRKADGALLATGTTRHPFLSSDGRVMRVAHELLPHLFESQAGKPPEDAH